MSKARALPWASEGLRALVNQPDLSLSEGQLHELLFWPRVWETLEVIADAAQELGYLPHYQELWDEVVLAVGQTMERRHARLKGGKI